MMRLRSVLAGASCIGLTATAAAGDTERWQGALRDAG